MIPNKAEFCAGELPRILRISKATVYRYIQNGIIRSEIRGLRIQIIRREWLVEASQKIERRRNGRKD